MKISLICLLICVVGGSCLAEDWDHFVFSMHWPQSICIERNETGHFYCSIPQKTNWWTIHGLWPTNHTSEEPNFCNGTAFNASFLDSIKDRLEIYWPNFFTDETTSSFWKHEWKKHGVCASSIESLNTELKYFNTTLSLLERFDITKGLAQNGVKASDRIMYTTSDFKKAFHSLFGSDVKMLCYAPQKRSRMENDHQSTFQYISEIELCLDKQFNPINCPQKTLPHRRNLEHHHHQQQRHHHIKFMKKTKWNDDDLKRILSSLSSSSSSSTSNRLKYFSKTRLLSNVKKIEGGIQVMRMQQQDMRFNNNNDNNGDNNNENNNNDGNNKDYSNDNNLGYVNGYNYYMDGGSHGNSKGGAERHDDDGGVLNLNLDQVNVCPDTRKIMYPVIRH